MRTPAARPILPGTAAPPAEPTQMPTPPTGCLCRQCPPSEQNVKATSAGVSRVAAQGAVRACCPRLIGGGNRHGVRSRNPRVRLRAGKPVLRAGRACPDQHGGRICEQFAAEGAGTPAGIGLSPRAAPGRFSRGQCAARGVRRLERDPWRPRPLGCHPPGGKRGPDAVALARRGLGPVVPGVGILLALATAGQ